MFESSGGSLLYNELPFSNNNGPQIEIRPFTATYNYYYQSVLQKQVKLG
jgi:hypothetical protein